MFRSKKLILAALLLAAAGGFPAIAQTAVAEQHLIRAHEYAADGNMKAAVREAEAAVKLMPQDAGAIGALASYLNGSDPRRATRLADQALQIDPRQFHALAVRATTAIHDGRYADAERDFASALSANPGSEQMWQGLIASKVLQRRYDEALADVGKLERAGSMHAGPIAGMRGEILFLARRYSSALTQFDLALQADPGNASLLQHRANTRTKLGDRAGAIADFDAAISSPLPPPHAKAGMLIERAQLREPKDRAGWEGDLSQAAKLNGGPSAAIALARGVMEHRSGNAEAARTSFLRAQSLAPNDPVMADARFKAMRDSGYFTPADEVLAKQIAIRTNGKYDAWLHNSVCWLMALSRTQIQEAMPYCERAIYLTKGKIAYRDSKAMLLLTLGQTDAAIAEYDAILNIDPTNASSFYGRGLAKLAKGNRADALADVTYARKLQNDIDDEFRNFNRHFPDNADGQAQ